MSLFHKICEKGFAGSIRMVRVKWKKKALSGRKRLDKKQVQAFKQLFKKNYDNIIIFENHFGFYNIMLQRPQHITRALSDDKTLVLYNSFYDIDFKDRNRMEKLSDSFYILDLHYYRDTIFRYLSSRKMKKYVMVYSTDTVKMGMIDQYRNHGFEVIYEYVDDINPDLISRRKVSEILDRHQKLIQNKDTYVIATSEKLYRNVLEINKKANAVLISNGVECSNFNPNVRAGDAEYDKWLKSDKIKVGYYGALASWVDYELLKKIAGNSDFQLILIGVEHDDSLKESGLLAFENVRYFGKIDYHLLAGYANGFDICTIPFVINDVTKATSPIKLFEYMSLEKPIVTTALPECRKYDVVQVAGNTDEFIERLYVAYRQKDDEIFKGRLRKCADMNSWNAKAEELKDFIERGKKFEGQA